MLLEAYLRKCYLTKSEEIARYAATLTVIDATPFQFVTIWARLSGIQCVEREAVVESDDCAMQEGTAQGDNTIQLGPTNGIQKWSRADAGAASAGRNPWEAIGVMLASVAMVQAVVILRWHRRNVQVEGTNNDAGVLHRLVQREESVDEFFEHQLSCAK